MKKILILAYDFPPYVSVGGLRPYCWYKYLHEFDVYSIVVTRQWVNKYGSYLDYIAPGESDQVIIEKNDKGTIIKTPYKPNLSNRIMLKYGESKYKFLRKAISTFYEFFQFLFMVGPKSQLYYAAAEYLKNNHVDCIISSGDPFVLFKYSARLSRKFNIPWIADYRDPWTQDFENQKNFFLKLWNTYFEKKIVKSAFLITTVSDFFKAKISSLLVNRKIEILPNGYDPEALKRIKGLEQQNKVLSITLAGTIYKWHPLESFLQACSDFIRQPGRERFQINFYGVNIENEINHLLRSKFQELINFVNIFPKMPNEDLLQKLARENVLLLFNDYSIVGTKIYDYISVQRKILFCYSGDEEANEQKRKYYNISEFETTSQPQAALINKTNSGIIVKDAAHLKILLAELYDEFITNGYISCNSVNIPEYSRKIQTNRLAEIIKGIPVSEKATWNNYSVCPVDKEVKKVIILAYYFPPCNMPGANRPYGWAKYLSENGYYPIIITRSWENEIRNPKDILLRSGEDVNHKIFPTHEVYYVPNKQNIRDKIYINFGEKKFVFVRRLLTFWELFFSQFFISVSSYKSLYYFTRKYLSKNPEIDVMIATGAPYMLFKFAFLLNKKYKIKWIADYRDDWNTTDIDIKPNLSNKILKRIEINSEKKWVGSAECYTTVSSYSVDKNDRFLNKKGYTVYNGYMPEDFERHENIKPFEKFTITFVGTLYPTQKIEVFLDAYKEFIDRKEKKCSIQLLFPGLAFDYIQSERVAGILKGYEEFFSITERIPKQEIIEIEHRTHLFLYIAHQNIKGIIGSKVYEYIGLKKPVILCPTDGESIEKILNDTGVGHICVSKQDAVEVLMKLYYEYQEDRINIEFTKDQLEMVSFYSRRYQAKILAGVLDKLSPVIPDQRYYFTGEKKKYQQCKRCVMDTSDPDIVFDENGCCNHCTSYSEKISGLVYQGEETDRKLALLIDRIKRKGKNKPFDCIVGVSGGVDSIYTAYMAKKLGLRLLAVHMDNGWNTELAVSNIEKILNKLNIELYTYVLDWEEFRDLQLAFLKASVVEAETPTDIAILAILHKVAEKYGIKYIFSGGNYATEGILPKYWHYNAKDVKYLKAVHGLFGKGSLKNFPTFGFQLEMYYKLIKGVRMIYLLNYIPYNKKEAISLLERELDWRNYRGKHHESVYTKFVQSYLLPEKFGIDYRHATFSTQICTGELTREEALSELIKKPYDINVIEEEKKYLCKKLCVTNEELDKIMDLPVRSYKDYPNDKKKLEFIYKVYRMFSK